MGQTDAGPLLEIPVTTLPLFKVPVHVSYLVYLAAYSPRLALLYFRLAVRLCRLTRTPLSLLLHPTDFLGCDDTQDLAFFPGMRMPSEKKLRLVGEIIRLLCDRFHVVCLQEHARQLGQENRLRDVGPRF